VVLLALFWGCILYSELPLEQKVLALEEENFYLEEELLTITRRVELLEARTCPEGPKVLPQTEEERQDLHRLGHERGLTHEAVVR